jgi:hypothetical protein
MQMTKLLEKIALERFELDESLVDFTLANNLELDITDVKNSSQNTTTSILPTSKCRLNPIRTTCTRQNKQVAKNLKTAVG